MELPQEYVQYFAGSGPREGELSVEPGWFQLWAPEEVAASNDAYEVGEFAPGFLGFGSSGGGEMLAFAEDGRVFMLPFVGMSPSEAALIAGSWAEFVERMEPCEED